MTVDNITGDLQIVIRPMQEADLDDVVALESIIFKDPWSRQSFQEVLSESNWNTIVSLHGTELVGYACWLKVDIESHLANIAVAESYRRKSVAKRLFDHILRDVTEADCEYLLLEVRTSNISAIAFYKKHGFELMYRRPNYYRYPVEDALVLVRYLNQDENEN